MHAQKMGSPMGECSFCSLRNLPKFCEMIDTACCVMVGNNIYTVTWQPNESGLRLSLENGVPPREMTKFFNGTKPEKLKIIFEKMAHDAIKQK